MPTPEQIAARTAAEAAAKAAGKTEAEITAAGQAAEALQGTGAEAPATDRPNDKGNVMLSPQQLRERLDRAKESGRKAVISDLDKQAQAQGFKDHAALVAAAQQARQRGGQSKPNKGQPNGKPGAQPAAPQNDERLARLEREFRAEKKKNSRLERRLHAEQAEFSLKEIAISAGVKDVDVAVELFKRHLKGLGEDEIKTLNERDFFDKTLRQERPYLFGVTVKPADTTNQTQESPGNRRTPPGDGTKPFDARTATPAQQAKWLQEQGMRVPRHLQRLLNGAAS